MFFRRNDERVKRLQGEIDRQMAVIGVLEGQIEKLFDAVESRSAELQSLLGAHNALLEAHRDLQRALEDARKVTPVSPTFSQVPLHVAEDEEDARWLYDQGEISKEELAEILKAADFDNAEIEFA